MQIMEQDLVQCPYDTTHRILKTRFQVHLTRCRKNHKNVEKVTCPFDSTHILNKAELEWHVSQCPERKSYENYKNKDERGARPTIAGSSMASAQVAGDENWDDAPDVPSYNPQEYASRANILRNIQGAPPSVRKQFRAEERLRLLGIKPSNT